MIVYIYLIMGLETKLEDLLTRNLFSGNPSQILCDGMTFCDVTDWGFKKKTS